MTLETMHIANVDESKQYVIKFYPQSLDLPNCQYSMPILKSRVEVRIRKLPVCHSFIPFNELKAVLNAACLLCSILRIVVDMIQPHT